MNSEGVPIEESRRRADESNALAARVLDRWDSMTLDEQHVVVSLVESMTDSEFGGGEAA